MKSVRTLFVSLLLVLPSTLYAQDLAFGRRMVDTLTGPYFWGRGYTRDGMKKAADFLAAQFASFGLKPMRGSEFFQHFSYPVNTFPGTVRLTINGKELQPGKDFLVGPESAGIKGSGTLMEADSVTFINKKQKLIVQLEDKLTWSAAPKEEGYTLIQLGKAAVSSSPEAFDIEVENRFVRSFAAVNVCGMVKGTRRPDSVLLITAHYDHLGGMGADTYFPGANDNASGVSLLLNLAHYYAAHPQDYTIGFICFAGEEIGLVGSKYFTEHPLVPLEKIRFLTNTDLAGTGSDGITVVNATEFPKEFAMMNEVNDRDKLLVAIKSRGKAANSDHYHFSEKGVPAFFFYSMGGIAAYHDIYDRAETLPMVEHEDLFRLVVGFNEKLMGK